MRSPALRVALFAFATSLEAQNPGVWSEPFPPHRIAGNLYYVGTRGLASYLITGEQGHVLINAGLESTVPMIEANVAALGFRFKDVKILLVSHAHWDHVAGSALVRERTGARYMVMEPDVAVVEDGGRSDFFYGNAAFAQFRPTKVDRALHDGDTVQLGATVLTARLTPGHTRGCTTWLLKVTEGGKSYDAVIVGSPNVNEGYHLVDNPVYPGIAADFALTFRILKSLDCDIFLGAHGDYYGLEAKYARLKKEGFGVFLDPAGYLAYIKSKERAFLREKERQLSNKP
ncbi:MAG: subclass B3 metallo-beta-lactamase [Acidobacteria bacterium]|nr:subclass B3 metallo-beta-lactamase [Acidobacteriota bacterium]